MGLWMCCFIFPPKSKERPRSGKNRALHFSETKFGKNVWSTEQKTLSWTLTESTVVEIIESWWWGALQMKVNNRASIQAHPIIEWAERAKKVKRLSLLFCLFHYNSFLKFYKRSYWDFGWDCIESGDKFEESWHHCNMESFTLWKDEVLLI
jgi:hypothetical protein